MSKLFKLREWISIADAVGHLTGVCKETVTEADIFHLALEGRLTLSVVFPTPISGRLVEPIAPDSAKEVGADVIWLQSGKADHLRLSGAVKGFDGIFDLPMIGGERTIVRGAEWQPSGPLEKFAYDEVLMRTADGRLIVPHDRISDPKKHDRPFDSPENFERWYGFPDEVRMVVRTAELLRLQDELSDADAPSGKAIGPREQTTYLNIIGSLVALMLDKSPAGKPLSVFDSQSAILEALLARHAGLQGLSQRTLEEKFAAAKRSIASA